jgi:hypothetical protein
MRGYTTKEKAEITAVAVAAYLRNRTQLRHYGMSETCRYCCKSLFEVVKEKFLEPLMRFTRGDVRDRIVSSKIDHGPP